MAGASDCGYEPSVSVKCRTLASQDGVCSIEEEEEEEEEGKEGEILEGIKGFVDGINRIKAIILLPEVAYLHTTRLVSGSGTRDLMVICRARGNKDL